MKYKIVTLLLLILLSFFSDHVIACSCIERRTVQEEVKYADAVLVGSILSKEVITLTDSTLLQLFPYDTIMMTSSMSKITIARYELLVFKNYKGEITSDTALIYTGIEDGDCGVRFNIGQYYIVYGEDKSYFDFKFPKMKNSIWTYKCQRTMPYHLDEITEIDKYTKSKESNNDELIFADPDSPPRFKNGGDAGAKQFIQENLLYPITGDCIQGKVYVRFTVDTLGNVKDVEIMRGLTNATDKEAIRVAKLMKFTTGTRYGKPIETKMIWPINFVIEQ